MEPGPSQAPSAVALPSQAQGSQTPQSPWGCQDPGSEVFLQCLPSTMKTLEKGAQQGGAFTCAMEPYGTLSFCASGTRS